ncbi:N-acetylneuraminate synthase [Pelosinus propionicus]|uniref:N-acetylneuraminate synthase n=1 Tax=Pelosinus propionicus DSM 13327 TaxID=1123291 RepID=A0A1I4HSM0_9FIRM|nr:N-acetylneuraminate synthase [Pelosinus propionicus]SFL45135.1 N-acetylneuraminate synthase [Pelosinus propionicus DSM 13327]
MNQNQKTYIIAEAGVNHNGSLELAMQLVDVAAECGADAVKFQTFQAENLVAKDAIKADYQKRTTDREESQFEMIKKLELDERAHHELARHCGVRGIQFLSTPFDLDSLELLMNFDMPYIKIPSGEITNGPFLLEIARTNKPVILSTGMSTLGEIEMALGVLAFGYLERWECASIEAFQEAYSSIEGRQLLQQKVSLMHCTTEYPAPFSDVNLRTIDTLRSAFNLSIGFSDHTPGISVPIAAVARGALLIEKHFTLDCNLPGPDHKASLEPVQLKEMIKAIRQIEEALGHSFKIPALSEVKNKAVARKSLIANHIIQKGEKFTVENLTAKRPGIGLSPMNYWDLLGKNAKRKYEMGEKVEL